MTSKPSRDDPGRLLDLQYNPPVTPASAHDGRSADEQWMQVALNLAVGGKGFVEPNPMVGCVLVRDGELIGQGYHRMFGGPHAEIEALATCEHSAGATAYVTLEPCCHFGKTPPCCDSLVRAGITRCVVAMADPFPKVDGGGLARLAANGIEVTVGVLAAAARQLNAPYLKLVAEQRPWVIAKWAMTLDGRIATTSGESQWITGESARRQVHQLRGTVDAIAVGMGTVLADNPRLTVRPPGPRVPARVIFALNRLPAPESALVQTAREIPVVLFAGQDLPRDQLSRLRESGVEVIACATASRPTLVDHAVQLLGEQKKTNLLVEGGGQLLASFFEIGQVDECHVYLGPKVVGGHSAPGPVAGDGVQRLADASQFDLVGIERFDDDMLLRYRRPTADTT